MRILRVPVALGTSKISLTRVKYSYIKKEEEEEEEEEAECKM